MRLYNQHNDAIYFASFGQVPPKSVIKYCKNKHFIHSYYIIQDIELAF